MVLPLGLKGYKKTVAEFFDARTDYSRSEIHACLANRLIRFAAPQPGEQVLDIATGTGFIAIPAAHLVGEHGAVVGVDISAGMLEQAMDAVSAASLTNVTLIQADAEYLNYPPDNFDLVVCCNALPYMTDVASALKRWNSLLRPDGRFVFNVWAEDSFVTGRLLRAFAARYGIQIAMIGRDTGTPERCHAILAAAGFLWSQVEVEPTAAFFSARQLEIAPDLMVKNPLYGIMSGDAIRLSGLCDEYIAESRSASVQRALNVEMGAYFVLGRKRYGSASVR